MGIFKNKEKILVITNNHCISFIWRNSSSKSRFSYRTIYLYHLLNFTLKSLFTFTNDLIPRSKQYPEIFKKTLINRDASIGANATIIAGNEIGEFALIGAGAVVTKKVGKNEVWAGNPAKKTGYISDNGDLLDLELVSKKSGKKYTFINNHLVRND